jgi:hypothetical protein
MQKVVLSEINLYYGEIKTPKGFEIQRSKIKNNIIESYINNKKISSNPKDYSYNDYQTSYSQSLGWLQDHVRDYFKLDYKQTLIPKLTWGNVYEYQQQSFLRNNIEPLDLKNSPDYTFVYGVDVGQDSCNMIIEYDDNRRANRTWHIPMNNNYFVMFPSTQKYFITKNKTKQFNVFLTTTYEYI